MWKCTSLLFDAFKLKDAEKTTLSISWLFFSQLTTRRKEKHFSLLYPRIVVCTCWQFHFRQFFSKGFNMFCLTLRFLCVRAFTNPNGGGLTEHSLRRRCLLPSKFLIYLTHCVSGFCFPEPLRCSQHYIFGYTQRCAQPVYDVYSSGHDEAPCPNPSGLVNCTHPPIERDLFSVRKVAQ